MTDTVDKVIIQSELQGVDQTATGLKKIEGGLDGIAVASDNVEKSTVSIESRFASLERRFQTSAGQAAQYEKIQSQVNLAVQQNPALQDRANEVLANAAAKFDAAKGSAGAFNAILDAGRGAALGYAAGIGPVGAVLGSFGPWGIAAAAGIGLVVNALDYMNTKANEIGTESSGLKQFADTTGLTVTQVRGLTEAGAELGIASDTVSSSIQKFTFSLDEARKGGGTLYDQVQAIDGQLANQLASTRSGAEALDILTKAYNSTADATTKAAIARAAFGRGGASFGAVLGVVGDAGGVDAYSASVQKALGVTDEWTNKVAALRNENRSLESDLKLIEASIYSEAALERQNRFLQTQIQIAKAVRDAAAGAGNGPSTDEFGAPFDFTLLNQNKAAKAAATTASDSPAAGVGETAALQAATKATNDLTAARLESAKAEEAAATSSGNMVSLLGGAATGAEIAEARFHKLSAAFLENKFGASDSADAIDKFNRALHGDTNNQVAALQDQRTVIEATTGQMKMAAQYAADYDAQLRAGKYPADALQIASERLANSEAAATKSVTDQVKSLKDQNAMIKARQDGNEAATAAAIAYKNAIDSGADSTAAAALKAATLANYIAQAGGSAQDLNVAFQAAADSLDRIVAGQFQSLAAAQEMASRSAARGSSANLTGVDAWTQQQNLGNMGTGSMFQPGTMPSGPLSFSADPSVSVSYANGGRGFNVDVGQTLIAVQQLIAKQNDPSNLANSYLASGNYAGAISAVETRAGGTIDDRMSIVDALTQVQNGQTTNKGMQAANLQTEMAWLNSLPETLARDQKIVSLQQSIDQLTTSTDSLNATNQDLLSPYYSQDPRTSHIGFRSQGMATGGYVDVPGSPSANDNMIATIPVASGERIYVDAMPSVRGSGGGTVVTINAPMTFVGPVDQNQVGRTVFQNIQNAARQLRAGSQ